MDNNDRPFFRNHFKNLTMLRAISGEQQRTQVYVDRVI